MAHTEVNFGFVRVRKVAVSATVNMQPNVQQSLKILTTSCINFHKIILWCPSITWTAPYRKKHDRIHEPECTMWKLQRSYSTALSPTTAIHQSSTFPTWQNAAPPTKLKDLPRENDALTLTRFWSTVPATQNATKALYLRGNPWIIVLITFCHVLWAPPNCELLATSLRTVANARAALREHNSNLQT